MKKLILLAIFCFNPLFIEQNISNVYLKSCKKATQKNVWQENGWQENGCRANVLYAAVTRCRNTKDWYATCKKKGLRKKNSP